MEDIKLYSDEIGRISIHNFIPEFKFAVRDDLDDEFLPSRSNSTDTGWDVRCAERDGIELHDGEYHRIRLGFRMLCPEGWWMELRPRSSSFANKQLHALYGVIDETYENEIMFACQYLEHKRHGPVLDVYYPPPRIEFGDRIGQIIPVRRRDMRVTKVSNEEYDRLCAERAGLRGTGGFGSSG